MMESSHIFNEGVNPKIKNITEGNPKNIYYRGKSKHAQIVGGKHLLTIYIYICWLN
jgi:hypothetical protein